MRQLFPEAFIFLKKICLLVKSSLFIVRPRPKPRAQAVGI